ALLALLKRGKAGGFEKALHGLIRRAFARAAPLLRLIGLRPGEARHRERQPAGGDEGFQRSKREAGGLEPLAREPLQVLRRARLHARRNFLGEELEEKIGHVAGVRARRAAPSPLPLPDGERGQERASLLPL